MKKQLTTIAKQKRNQNVKRHIIQQNNKNIIKSNCQRDNIKLKNKTNKKIGEDM